MMNTKIELPETDIKHLYLAPGELVVLRPELDDTNFARVYMIEDDFLDVDDKVIIVKVISEKPINQETQSQGHSTWVEENSLVGKTFSAERKDFLPYL